MTESNSVQLQNRRWYAKVIKKNGSDKLYIKLFYHRPEPFVRSTYLDNNEDNRKTVDGTVARINADIQAGTFNFSKAFDGASEEDKKFLLKKKSANTPLHPMPLPSRQRTIFGKMSGSPIYPLRAIRKIM